MRFRPATPATLALAALLTVAPLGLLGWPDTAQAQQGNAQARVHFEEGNRHFARAGRLRGARRQRELEQALAAYMETLAIVRSRNALFNTASVLEQLERHAEAFAHVREYLAIRGLTEEERADGEAKMAALRERVAVVAAVSEPAGAEVYVDRLDLAPRGRAPLEVALEPGSHRVYFRLPHHETAEVTVEAATGETVEARATLKAEPVAVTLEVMAPADTRLTLDGEAAEAGAVELAPGLHVARLEPAHGTPVERRFEVRPGEPMRVRLEVSGAAVAAIGAATLVVSANVPVQVSVDSAPVGEGEEVRSELSAGSHLVEVRAEGREALRRLVQLRPGETTTLHAEIAPETRPLGPLPHIALGLTALGVGATVGLGVYALRLEEDNHAMCRPGDSCAQLLDEVRDANRRADVALGVTAALAITTLVLYLLNRPRGDASLDVHAGASRTGGSLTLGGRF